MSRLLRRFRMLLPPSAYIVCYVLIYLIASLPLMLVGPAANNNPAIDPMLRYPPVAVHFVGLALYGIYRAAAFHPLFREEYRRWLETTPWTLGKPLPVGPAHLVWEDAVIVAAAGLPEWLAGDVQPLASYSVAIGAYLIWLCLTFATTRAWGFQFLVLFGVGLALRLWRERPEVYAIVVLVSYMIGLTGLRRSFRHWPWADVKPIDLNQQVNAAKNTALGWPFDRLGPVHEPAPSRRVAWGYFFSALLAGWWCYALEHVVPDPNGQFMMMRGIVMNVTLFMVAIRLATTLTGYAPPISLAGRIARFRPLIPSYDQVFLSPLAAALAVMAGPGSLEHAGVPRDVALGLCATLAMMALWLGGPERRTWHLTAKHRITAGINSGANKTGDFVQTG
jgi:hypothetical protein